MKKNTKRSLLLSVLALILCCALLAGTTLAWFTDTASSGVNKIQAGNLDIEVTHTGANKSGTVEGSTELFTDVNGNPMKWEPGAVAYETFTIKNVGSLALKYKLDMNIVAFNNVVDAQSNATGKNLKDVLKVKFLPQDEMVTDIDRQKVQQITNWDTVTSTLDVFQVNGNALYPESATGQKNEEQFQVVVYWQPGPNDNDWNVNNGKTTDKKSPDGKDELYITFGIDVVATQLEHENDSFGNTYDANATYPVVVSRNELNTSLTLNALKDENGKVSPVEVTLGNTSAEEINYNQNNSGYTGRGVMLGSANLNNYAATPAAAGEYKFTFKDGTITSAATGYGSIDNYSNTSVYMLVPGNSDVVFENMTFNGVVSFDIQKYTSPWSNLNSISFKNCTFNGIIIGTCPASNVTFDGCTFNAYTNTEEANNSNPIWWREDTEGSGANANPIKTFTFVNNTVTGTRPVKIERIGHTESPTFTIKDNTFDISRQADGDVTKNMAINIGMGENPNLPFTLIDEGNTISENTAALYTASLTGGSNQYRGLSGMKVLDGNGNNKVITALVWKTTTNQTFELKTVS